MSEFCEDITQWTLKIMNTEHTEQKTPRTENRDFREYRKVNTEQRILSAVNREHRKQVKSEH